MARVAVVQVKYVRGWARDFTVVEVFEGDDPLELDAKAREFVRTWSVVPRSVDDRVEWRVCPVERESRISVDSYSHEPKSGVWSSRPPRVGYANSSRARR